LQEVDRYTERLFVLRQEKRERVDGEVRDLVEAESRTGLLGVGRSRCTVKIGDGSTSREMQTEMKEREKSKSPFKEGFATA